jgi:hypothetical protein
MPLEPTAARRFSRPRAPLQIERQHLAAKPDEVSLAVVPEAQDDRSRDAPGKALGHASVKISDSSSRRGVVELTVGAGPGQTATKEFVTYGPGEGLGLGIGCSTGRAAARRRSSTWTRGRCQPAPDLHASLTRRRACLCAGSPIGEVGFFTGIRSLEAAESVTVCRTLVINKRVGGAAGPGLWDARGGELVQQKALCSCMAWLHAWLH